MNSIFQLLDEVKIVSNLKVICLDCWQHISDFHNFQQWILNARTQDFKFVIKEEVDNEQITVFDTNPSGCNETSSKEISMLECSHCKELFQSYEALDTHFKLCRRDLNSNKELNAKLNFFERKIVKIINERDKNAFKCDTCEASFSQYGNLRRHVRKQHAVQPLLKWICKYCNKLFKKKSLLERHKNALHENQSSDKSQKQAKQVVDNKENNVKSPNEKTKKICQTFFSNVEDEKELNTTENTSTVKFSIKSDFEDEDQDLEIVDNVAYAEIKPKTPQIHRPTLEIIDVKTEILSEDDDMNNTNTNEFYIKADEKFDKDTKVQNDGLECPRCSEHVKNYPHLKNHFDVQHPDERCYINCCHTTLYEEESILEHLRFHKNPNAFKCNECGKCFKGGKGLSSHKLQVHSNNRSTYHLHLCCCKAGIEQHERKLAKGQQMEYDMRVCCQRKKKILEDDKLIAKWRKELTCEICKANFPFYSLMRSHSYYAHPGEKCYILCCQRKMSRISDTLEHIRFHLNPHLYRCEKCKVDFSGKSTLAKHMRNAHKDSLPKYRWACDMCDKTFEIQQILTRHKNVCHSKKV